MQPAFETKRLRVFHISAQPMDQNTERDVFIAFRIDIDRPLVAATAVVLPPAPTLDVGRWVDWLEVSSEYRRAGFGRELVAGIECHLGAELILQPGSDDGAAFCAAMHRERWGAC